MKTAVISGTFDPITVGHTDIIARAGEIFDRVVIAVSDNSEKKCMFDAETRLKAVRLAVDGMKNVEAEICRGLLSDFCREHDNACLVRGARNGSDFDYERQLYIINKKLGVKESIILPASGGIDHISSTYARDMLIYGKSVEGIIPASAVDFLVSEYAKTRGR